MNRQRTSIDLVRLAIYVLKRAWLLVLCAAIGFGVMYWRASKAPDTYTASGTMYVYHDIFNWRYIGYGEGGELMQQYAMRNPMQVSAYAQMGAMGTMTAEEMEAIGSQPFMVLHGKEGGGVFTKKGLAFRRL